MGASRAAAVSHSVNEAGAPVTITAPDAVADAPPAPPHRRRWPWVVAGLFVAVLVAAGVSAVVYAHTYSPLGEGQYGFAPTGAVRAVTDGVTDPTQFIIVGPAGSTGVITYALANNGSHPVRILGADVGPNSDLPNLTSVRWSPEVDAHNNPLDARRSGSRAFPVTVSPHQQISLYVSVSKPGCAPRFTEQISAIPLATEALHVHHEWDLPLAISSFDSSLWAPINLCSPKSALQHLSKR
jgi:hypothetical protein